MRRDHPGDRHVPPDLVRDRDHARLGDARHRFEAALDLLGVHVLSVAHEHVVLAAEEVEEAVRVAPHDVAGAVVAVGRHRLCRLIREPMVARHDRGAPHLEHPAVGFRAVRADEAEVDGRVTAAEREVGGRPSVRVRAEDDGPRLRRPVSDLDPCARERVAKARDELRGDRGGAHADAPDRREVGGGEALGLPADEGKHGRDRGDEGAAVPLDGVDVAHRIEARHQDDGGAGRERELGEGEGVHVVEGGRDEDPLRPMVDPRLAALVDDPAVSAVGEGHSLGRAARARGVEEHRDILRLGPDDCPFGRGRKPVDCAKGNPVDPGGEVVGALVAEREPRA